MKIGLIDADGGTFPNLALMKISAYYKRNQQHTVEWLNHWEKYDKVFISKVFTQTSDPDTVINCDDVWRGGTGYDLDNKLPCKVEAEYPDYTLYPSCYYALGFLTRGCSRKCPFCIVYEKEGSAHKVADVRDIWRGQSEIKLLDPNLLEYTESLTLLHDLLETKAKVDFTQGLDIRLITTDHISVLKKMKVKRVHFAYDMMIQSDLIERNLANFMQVTGWVRGKVTVYILTNYNTNTDEDLHRIRYVKSIGATPYVMLYGKHTLQPGSVQRRMQRWVNSPQIFNSTDWENYQRRST